MSFKCDLIQRFLSYQGSETNILLIWVFFSSKPTHLFNLILFFKNINLFILTQRDRVEREVGVGIGMGNTCKSMADSCQCMTKTTMIL